MSAHTRTKARVAGSVLTAVATTVGALALSAGSASATNGGTLFVSTTGTDSGTCRLQTAPCRTIGYALLQAPTNSHSTIKIAAGHYPEQLTINRSVTLQGAGRGATFIDPSTVTANDTEPSGPTDAIIDVRTGFVGSLTGLTVDGANAVGSFSGTGCANDFVGVYYNSASGTLNSVGVNNIALDSPSGPLFGCQDGLGIYAVGTSTVTTVGSSVAGYQKNGITCDSSGVTCNLSTTKVTGVGATAGIAQNGVQISNGAAATLKSDTVKGNTYTGGNYSATGVLIYDAGATTVAASVMTSNDANFYAYFGSGDGYAAAPLVVKGSSATNGTGSFADGIDVDSATQATLYHNVVTGNAEFGVALYGASGASVTSITAKQNGTGIYLGAGSASTVATGNTISGNTSSANAVDGVLATADTSGNSILSNTLSTNRGFDAEDRSTGSGTVGTANTWNYNTCTPANDSSPAALCGTTAQTASRASVASHGAARPARVSLFR